MSFQSNLNIIIKYYIMQRKTALLIPSSYYLSDEIFEKLAAATSLYNFIYLDPNDSVYKKINTSHKTGFDSNFGVVTSLPQDIYSGKSRVLGFLSKQIKKIQIILKVLKIKPDLIITTSDGTYAARVVAQYFSKIPFFVLQTALIAVDREKYVNVKKSILKRCFKAILGYILFPFGSSLRPYGLNHKYSRLLLWGDSSAQLLRPYVVSQDIKVVGNALFELPKAQSQSQNSVLFLAPDAKTNDEVMEFCKYVKEVVSFFPKLDFKIRLHPIMSREIYESFFKREALKNVMLANKEESLAESLVHSAVVISEYSAASFDAIAMGKKIILYKKEGESYLTHWFEELAVPKVSTTRGVIGSLELLVGGDNQATPVEISGHWFATGPLALENILNEINSVMKDV